jgi:hypothetical protein
VILRELERLKATYGPGASAAKVRLLTALETGRLRRAGEVHRLHEVLCFLRAYPDDAQVLALVERMLGAFDRRADLRRNRRALAGSGIAGTDMTFRFFAPVAFRLARRWGGRRLTIDWGDFDRQDRLEPLLPLLALYAETPGLDERDFSVREWLRRMKGPTETDAGFLLRRFSALPLDEATREKLYDALDVPLHLAPVPGGPSRTLAHHGGAPVAFQTRPLSRERPRLAEAVRRRPLAVRAVPRREAQALLELARDSMVTRQRDLDVFSYGDEDDVRIVDYGDGLRFACIGAIPERRLLLEAVYGFLTLKNGVPIGYVLASGLFRSSEIAYNVFDTFRGAEAAPVYGCVLSMARHLFGADSFTVFPYQLGGQGNEEGLRSGAFWFYEKLGFAPRDPDVRRLLREEHARMRTDPSHRSDLPTLRNLAAENVYWQLGPRRDDVIGVLQLADVGLWVTKYVAERFGSDREAAARTCAREAMALLGVGSLSGWSAGERLAWERWAPLVCILPNVRRWPAAARRALALVIRAKGGRRETDFVRRFDAHRRLRADIRALAESGHVLW